MAVELLPRHVGVFLAASGSPLYPLFSDPKSPEFLSVSHDFDFVMNNLRSHSPTPPRRGGFYHVHARSERVSTATLRGDLFCGVKIELFDLAVALAQHVQHLDVSRLNQSQIAGGEQCGEIVRGESVPSGNWIDERHHSVAEISGAETASSHL
jgi:hypothetical protein